MLFAELERLVNDLIGSSVCCELWIDGSFLTEKEEPDDIDLTVTLFPDDFDKLDPNAQTWMWSKLRAGKAYSPYLHVFLVFRFLDGDPRRAADKTAYWSEIWGKGWDDWLTGYVAIATGESDVGFRLIA